MPETQREREQRWQRALDVASSLANQSTMLRNQPGDGHGTVERRAVALDRQAMAIMHTVEEAKQFRKLLETVVNLLDVIGEIDADAAAGLRESLL